MQRNKVDAFLTPHTRVNPKWTKHLNIRAKTRNLLEGNMDVNCDRGFGKAFLNTKSTNNKRKIKTSVLQRTPSRLKTAQGVEKVFVTLMSGRGTYPEYIKNAYNPTIKGLRMQECNQKRTKWGAWVAHPTLDLSSGHDLRIVSSSPALGSVLGVEPT